MAKYNYVLLTDVKNYHPKRVPCGDVAAATVTLNLSGVTFDSTQDVDDAREFWNGTDLMGIFGISKNMLYYARFGTLNTFIP